MDNFIIRWYNQNRRMIWIVALSIVGVIVLIQSLNNHYKSNSKEESSSISNSTTTYNKPNYSVITQEEVSETVSKDSSILIEDFFKYCNSMQIENAYNLLSAECKEELYPTIDDFKLKYYNRIFTEQKSYDLILWIENSGRYTYRVEIMPDLLATGKKDSMPIEDYYTVIYEDGKNKLNINNYIGKKDINISKTENNITINILSKKMYIDYEVYEINVQNNTGSKLIFNTKENTESIYIQDENELKYIAFLNEISNSELEILNGSVKELKIRFNRGYKPEINIEKIIFEDISNNSQIQSIEVEM